MVLCQKEISKSRKKKEIKHFFLFFLFPLSGVFYPPSQKITGLPPVCHYGIIKHMKMSSFFRKLSFALIFALASYLFIILWPARGILKHEIESKLSKATGVDIKINSLSTDIFSTIILRGIKIDIKGIKPVMLDKLLLRYNPSLLFGGELTGYVIDKKLNALFSLNRRRSGESGISFKIFPSNQIIPAEFTGENVEVLTDFSIKGETAVFGEAFFKDNEWTRLNMDVILSAVSITSEGMGLYISGLSGNIPFNTGDEEKKEAIFIKSVKIKDIAAEDIRAGITSKNSLLTSDDLEYNMYGGKGKGLASFSPHALRFSLNSSVKSLDLERFDNASKGFKTKATGAVNLDVALALKGASIEKLAVTADSSTGGKIKQEVILALLSYLPKEKQAGQLAAELLKDNEFIYDRLNGEFTKKEKDYTLHLVFDGRHFLEFNINIEEETLGTLSGLFK